jgi:hypothetical protein
MSMTNATRRCNMSRIDATRWLRKIWIIIRAHKTTIDTRVSIREEILKLV